MAERLSDRQMAVLQHASEAGEHGVTSQDIANLLGTTTALAAVLLKRLRSETVQTVDRERLLTRTVRVRQSVAGRPCVVHTITAAGLALLAANPNNQPDNNNKKEG